MPNLAGVFNMGATRVDTGATIERMTRVLDVPGVDYTTRSWRDDRFGAVNILTGIIDDVDQPASEGNKQVLFLDGEISNLDEVWNVDVRGPAPSPAIACLALYREAGEGFVQQLNGQFNILIYEDRTSSVKIFNDRFGYRPLYYRCVDSLAFFTVEKKALFAGTGRTATFDAMGVFELLVLGHNLEDRTVFSGIRSMAPGSVLEFRNGREHLRQYWKPVCGRLPAGLSFDDAADEYGRLLCRAVERRSKRNQRYGIFLSGGLDSRVVAGALARVRCDVASFSFGPDDSPNLKYGMQIGDALGFACHRLLYDDVSLADILPKIVWRTEAALPFNESLSIARHRTIRARATIIFNRLYGGLSSGQLLLPGLFLSKNAEDVSKHTLSRKAMLSPEVAGALLKPEFRQVARNELMASLERELLSFGEDRMPVACNLWNTFVRVRRRTFSALAVDRYIVEPVTPFVDSDLVDWLFRMPVRYLFGQRLYKRMIVRTFPEIASIPWDKTGRPIPTNYVSGLAAQARIFAMNRLRWRAARGHRRTVAPLLLTLKTYVESNLLTDALPSDLFDPDAASKLARAALDGTGSPDVLIRLATLAESHRLFGTNELTGPPPETLPDL